MLIVLEGLDGAGKSTQTAKLREYLGAAPRGLKYIHFPRYDAPVYGRLISRFLRGELGTNESVHPQLVALLFAEDRHLALPEMNAALASGETVLLDRYVYSNVAYQCAKLGNAEEAEVLRKWILDTEYGVFGLPRPDVNIFLDVPISFVSSRLSASRDGDDRDYLQGSQDIHESDIAFQVRVRDIYRAQAGRDSSFIRVDCSDSLGDMLSADAIFDKIRKLIDGYALR